jgi:DNA replication protein DnaC
VGYIPFDAEAANLFLQLISACYERASMLVTSNKPSAARAMSSGDAVVAAAMIDPRVHHASVVTLKGDSHGLNDPDLGGVPAA